MQKKTLKSPGACADVYTMYKLTEQCIEQAVDYLFGAKTNANAHESTQATNPGTDKNPDITHSLYSWNFNRDLLDLPCEIGYT